jgi:hypothetical protein
MKNIAIILFLAWSFNANAFEGIIKVKYVSQETGDLPMSMNWFIGGDKVLLEIVTIVEGEEERLFLLPNPSENKLYLFNDNPAENGKLFYTEVGVEAIKGNELNFSGRKTGRQKEIDSRNCTEVTAEGDGLQLEMWVDPSIDIQLYRFADFFKTNYEIPALASIEMTGFPILSRVKDNYGENVALFEVESIEEVSIDDSKFSLPAGYVASTKVFEDEE